MQFWKDCSETQFEFILFHELHMSFSFSGYCGYYLSIADVSRSFFYKRESEADLNVIESSA